MTIDTIIISKPYDILTPQQAFVDLGLRHITYIYIMLDQDRLDKTYPWPHDYMDSKGRIKQVPASGPMFIVVNEKYEELKEKRKKRRK